MSVIAVDAIPDDPLAALRAVADSEHELGRIRRQQVIAARAAGASWQQVGDALGMTRQSAWELFASDAAAILDATAGEDLTEDEANAIAASEVSAVRRRRRSS